MKNSDQQNSFSSPLGRPVGAAIEVIWSKEKHRLTILKDGKPAGGFAGPIAHRMARKIIINNAKVEVRNGYVQVGV